MAEKYGFFNSVSKDRVYDATDVAKYISNFFTNGIFNNGLQVSANDNMTVNVDIGNANINGYCYELDEPLTLDIANSDSTLPRIDSIIIRLDLNNRQITTQVLQGSYASTPSQPNLTRTNQIYDLRLANITIPAGENRITSDLITDARFGSDCGNVVQAVQHLDTTDIFKQYQTAWDTWFETVKTTLDGDVAGNLQNEITNLRTALGLDTDTFTIGESYDVGDMVVYNYTIYECNVPHVAEEFEIEKWDIVPIIKN